MFQFDADSDTDSDKSVVDSINSYIDAYSSSLDCISKNNSYKTHNFLNILNDEIKYKFFIIQNKYYRFIYKNVLIELRRLFYSKKQYKILYNIVLNEIKNRNIIFFGKMYKNFIDCL